MKIIKTEEVTFPGGTITGVVAEDGNCYVAPRGMCESMGINWSPQRTKIMSDPLLSTQVIKLNVPDTSGRMQEMFHLPIEAMHAWLMTIRRMKLHQDAIDLYRAHSSAVLNEWHEGNLKKVAKLSGVGKKVTAKTRGMLAKLKEANATIKELRTANKDQATTHKRVLKANKALLKNTKHSRLHVVRLLKQKKFLTSSEVALLNDMVGTDMLHELSALGLVTKPDLIWVATEEAIKQGYAVNTNILKWTTDGRDYIASVLSHLKDRSPTAMARVV